MDWANLTSAGPKDKGNVFILAPNDGTARSIADVFASDKDITKYYITGQDAEVASVKAMIAGEQMFTVFKDTRELAKQVSVMVDAALQGKEVPINDTKTYDNGVKIIPSNLLVPVAVGKDDIQKVLVDSGYIAADKLK